MSVADLYDLELIWPSLEPTDVIVTGTFDQWSSSIRLVKGDAGFTGTVKVSWHQKVAYKFIVDGRWQYRDDLPREDDGDGNINNVFQTPEKPESPAVHNPLTRLSIPLDGALGEGYSAVENMVTAIEFLPSAEPLIAKESPPLPIPQITVEGLGQIPSPVNGFKLNTAAATEGNISPALVPPGEITPPEQAPSSNPVVILPLNDSNSVPLPPINGNGVGSDGFMTHAPIRFTKGEPPISRSVPRDREVVVATPSGSTEPQNGHSSQAAQANDTPVAIPEPPAKQPETNFPETVAQSPRQRAAAPPSNVSTPSTPATPASSTLIPKKRRSLFARIKHIFDKNKVKQEGKEMK